MQVKGHKKSPGGSHPSWPFLSPHRPGWDLFGKSIEAEDDRSLFRQLVLDRVRAEQPEPHCPACVTLAAMKVVAQLRDLIDRELRLLVVDAHAHGASWAEIAKRLGCSRQSAHERFKDWVHSDEAYEALYDDLLTALDRAHTITLSADADEEQSEQAFLLLETQEQIDGAHSP